MPYKNPEDRKAYLKKWKEENRERYIKAIIKSNKKSKKRNRKIAKEYKAKKGCKYCSENDPIVLDFHHPDPTKKQDNPSTLIGNRQWSVERLIREMKKWEVVCANCHRKITYNGNVTQRTE